MSIFLLSDGVKFYVMSTVENCGLTEEQILAKDVPDGFTAKKTTAEEVESTPLAELWNSL